MSLAPAAHNTSFMHLPYELRFEIYRLALDLDPNNPSVVDLKSRCEVPRHPHHQITRPSATLERRGFWFLLGRRFTSGPNPLARPPATSQSTPHVCPAPLSDLQSDGGCFDAASLLRVSQAVHADLIDPLYACRIFKLHTCQYAKSSAGTRFCATHFPIGWRNLPLVRHLTLCWDLPHESHAPEGQERLTWGVRALLPQMTGLDTLIVHVGYHAYGALTDSDYMRSPTHPHRLLFDALWDLREVRKEFVVLVCGFRGAYAGRTATQELLRRMEREKGERPPFKAELCSVKWSQLRSEDAMHAAPPLFPLSGSCYHGHCFEEDLSGS